MPGGRAAVPGPIFFLRRDRRGDDPYLAWKVRIFAVGAVLAVVGVALERRLLVWAALAVLGVGFGLAVLGRMGGGSEEGSEDS